MDIAAKGDLNPQASHDLMAKTGRQSTVHSVMDTRIEGLNVMVDAMVNVESNAGVANTTTGPMPQTEAAAINTIRGRWF